MCDQTEISYSDEEVVWVKLGNCWWPGEVVATNKLAPDILQSFRKPPIAVVKFFQEDAYEFVKNINSIYKYQCSRKHEFINKGLHLYRTRHGQMEKFPEDVIRAETKVGGDIEILTRDEFQETKKESYAGLFGTPAKKPPGSVKKGRGRPPSESLKISTPVRRMREKTDYKVHILVQGSKSTTPESPVEPAKLSAPSTSTAECSKSDEPTTIEPNSDHKPENVEQPITEPTVTTPSTPTTPSSGPGIYACHACPFTTTRLNVLILHNKSHSVGFISYTPTPIKKKPLPKPTPKSTPVSSKSPKQRKPRKEKTDKPKSINKKRSLDEKTIVVESKKLKTDEEIKSSLLADWDDDADDESNDESAATTAQSPEVPLGAESPAVPTSAELTSAAEMPPVQAPELSPVLDKKTNSSLSTEKPEASSDSNKYEFCEDEDWPVEADAGRKIPRVKNPIRTEESKSISIDEDDMAREVAELLNRTAVPELPSVPKPLKVEENFPEPSVVKSPDKKNCNSPGKAPYGGVTEAPTTKAIFKTKTFFRSRHSRSQDAIGKYVAEQLNNVEKMDIVDSDLNGSDNVSSPEARDSPPIEQVKVARLAPKIQLKRMKAEAQLREKERNRYEPSADPYSLLADIMVPEEKPNSTLIDDVLNCKPSKSVLYPTQEIKPVSEKYSLSEERTLIVEEPVVNNDVLTEGDDTRDTTEEDHHVTGEESESSQDTYTMEIDQVKEITKPNQEIVEEVVQNSVSLYQENVEKYIELPSVQVPDQMLCETPDPPEPSESFDEHNKSQPPSDPYINESTASAVDALLSVARDKDRETRVISDDPPEDLFEDDKEDSINSNINGELNIDEEVVEDTEVILESEQTIFTKNEQEVVTEEVEIDQDTNAISVNNEHIAINENTDQNMSYESQYLPQNEEVTNKEPDLTEVSTNAEEVKDSDESIYASQEELHTGDMISNNSQIHFNVQYEETNDEDVLTGNKNEPTVHKETDSELPESELHIPENESHIPENESHVAENGSHIPENESHIPENDSHIPENESHIPENESHIYENQSHIPKNVLDISENEIHVPESYDGSDHVIMHSGFSENEEEIVTTQVSEESVYLQNEDEIPAVQDETEIPVDNNTDEYIASSEIYQNEEVVTTPCTNQSVESLHEDANENVPLPENVPSESDLQIAEALINLPATVHTKTPTDHLDNHIMTSSFEMDNVQEEVIPSSEENVQVEVVTLANTPKSTNKSKQPNDESVNVRFETEQEKSENLNAAQSLLHMSESIEHAINAPEPMDAELTEPVVLNIKQNNGIDKSNLFEISPNNEPEIVKKPLLTSSSKLLQMLEEPSRPKFASTQITSSKHIVMRGKEKILNFDVAKSTFKSKPNSPKQKIIIRRTTPSKTILNNINEVPVQDKIILSRSNPSQDGSSVQRFTIQTTPDAPSDANTIIIQQKIRKLSKPAAKLQKIKPHTSLVTSVSGSKPVVETSVVDNAIFDINSMPIVLSEDLITAESIEQMPVVMSDANISPIIPQPQHQQKIVKPKVAIAENEKITVTSMPKKNEVKSKLLMNSTAEVQNKAATPNILSKSTKLRAAKPMLVIDKTTGKQKIIMTKAEPALKEVKQIQKSTIVQKAPTLIQKTPTLIQKTPTIMQKTTTLLQKPPTLIQKTPTMIQTMPTLIQTNPTLLQTTQTLIQTTPTGLQAAPLIQAGNQSAKKSSQCEKFIILPTQNASQMQRGGRTQKIVIDPQTGKAHVILSKGNETAIAADNKPVSAKLIPSKSETAPGNTVMIITNAQGAQSRIVLTPEHEKILFPNKQQQKGSQLKTIAHRITTTNALKTVLNPPAPKQIVTSAKTPTRIVPKQKNAIITSKGQLIVGGRVATTAQNIAPMPEPRQITKRIVQTEPKKLVQIQKTNSEPLIFLHQKSGAVMQLTAAQFDQLQRSGQIVQKTPTQPVQERVIIQKTRTIAEAGSSQKSRVRKGAAHSPSPAKRSKPHHEIAIAPAPARLSPQLPALTPIVPAPAPVSAPVPAPAPPPLAALAPAPPSAATFSELDNLEEMLPSTAIARQPAPEPAAPEPPAEPTLADSQLLAVPGEHFGGPVGSFYLCVEEQGTYTPIDNRPLVLENNQLMPMSEMAAPAPATAPRDILSAALANSEVFHADAGAAPDFRDLNANVSVHCRVSETSTTLHQPIMTPQEVPSGARASPPASLEAGLAVIGVRPGAVPTSLELPITVTDPRIAPRASDPLQCPALLTAPSADLCLVAAEQAISMPLLTEEELPGGPSMPSLTDDLAERAASSAGSAEDATWGRRLLTPGSDTSDLSAEIPLQPSIQLSVGDLSDHS